MNKRIITAALTGAVHTPSMSPYLPVTPKQLADEAVRVHEAGAAVAHVHVRDPETGMPNADQDNLPGDRRGRETPLRHHPVLYDWRKAGRTHRKTGLESHRPSSRN